MSVSAPPTPMRLASHLVSGKVSNMTATKSVMGSARNAPGPPSSHAQKINDKNTIVGEMFKPRPINIGEQILGQYVDHHNPNDHQHRSGHTELGQGQHHCGCHSQDKSYVWYEARKKVRIPQSIGKSTPNKNNITVTAAPVTRLTMARSPYCRTTLSPTAVSRAICGVVRAGARSQPVHHGRSFAEQEQHDHQDEEEITQETSYAAQDQAGSLGKGAGFHYLLQIHVRKPQTLEQGLEIVQFTIQLRYVVPKAIAERGDRGAKDEDESREKDDQ